MSDQHFRREHAELIADLRRNGFDIESLNEWMQSRTPLAAQSILLRHLDRCTTDDMKNFIARVMTQKGFEGAVPSLLDAFESCLNDSARWAIAYVVAYLGIRKQHWQQVLRLVADPQFGGGRQNLVGKLHHIKASETEPLLVHLIDDADVDAFAVSALGYCGGDTALKVLQAINTEGRTPLFKREVPKAIMRIERRIQRQLKTSKR